MNWLLKAIAYVVVVFVFAIVDAVLISILGIEISGSMGIKVVHYAVWMLLSWALLLILFGIHGAKITWPD